MSEQSRASENHGLDLRVLAWVLVGLCGLVLTAAAGAYLAWRGASATPRLLAPNAPAQTRVAGVALESAPRSGRAAHAAEKERLLHAHEWIDADAGIARIPIDVAMRVLVQRDAATRAGAPAPRPSP